MQVNGIKSYNAPSLTFGSNAEEKQTNKKAAIAAGVGVAAVAVGTTAYALKRGKLLTEGKEVKFFEQLKEGFKSFVGENRVKYLETLKAKYAEMIEKGKKSADGNYSELTNEAKEAIQKKVSVIDEKISSLKDKLAQRAARGAEKAAASATGEEPIKFNTEG